MTHVCEDGECWQAFSFSTCICAILNKWDRFRGTLSLTSHDSRFLFSANLPKLRQGNFTFSCACSLFYSLFCPVLLSPCLWLVPLVPHLPSGPSKFSLQVGCVSRPKPTHGPAPLGRSFSTRFAEKEGCWAVCLGAQCLTCLTETEYLGPNLTQLLAPAKLHWSAQALPGLTSRADPGALWSQVPVMVISHCL